MTLSQGNLYQPTPVSISIYTKCQKLHSEIKQSRQRAPGGVSLLAQGASLEEIPTKAFYSSIPNPQMQQLKEPFEKTKKFFHKRLRDLKKFLPIGGYRQLTKSTSCNPFTKSGRGDCHYNDFCDGWKSDLDEATKTKNVFCDPKDQCREEVASNGSSIRVATSPTKKKAKKSSSSRKSEDQLGNIEGGGYPLARKMKELELVDGSDVEHVLDVEEALHYYSRLRSPVYLELVDKFFADMYTEFSAPPASASITSSKRRLSSRF